MQTSAGRSNIQFGSVVCSLFTERHGHPNRFSILDMITSSPNGVDCAHVELEAADWWATHKFIFRDDHERQTERYERRRLRRPDGGAL